MAEGVFARTAIAIQNSFGTINTSSFESIPFTDESISDTINVLRPDTLTGSFFEVDAVRGLEDVSGDVNVVAHPEMTGVLLRSVFGQTAVSTTNVSSGYYEHEFIPKNSNFEAGVALTPYTVSVYRDTETEWQYTDCQIHSMNLSLGVNDFLKMNIGIVGRVASLATVTSLTAPSDAPFVYDQATVSINSAAFTNFETLEISFANNIEGVQVLNGTRQHAFFHRTDKMQVRFNGTMNFLNNSDYIDFKSFNQRLFELSLKDTSVTSGNEVLIQVPKFRMDSYSPTIGGMGRVSVDFTATGELDTNSSYAVRVTMINSRTSYA